MLIRYSKKRVLPNLVIGCSFLVLGFLMVYKEPANLLRYGYVLIGMLYLGIWLFERRNQYLVISDGVLTKKKVKPKHILLSEVKRIVQGPGTITLYSQNDRIRINTELIDKRSLEDLHRVLDNLEIGPEENPVHTISFDPSSK